MTKTSADPSTLSTPVGRVCEHILVVEDDEMVRSYVVKQLISLGYVVSEAMDGPTGLEIIRERLDIDLLVTDLVMPGGMSGRDLAEAVQQLRPNLPILLTSGYHEDSIANSGLLDQGFEMLQKPYRRQELAQRLRKMLQG